MFTHNLNFSTKKRNKIIHFFSSAHTLARLHFFRSESSNRFSFFFSKLPTWNQSYRHFSRVICYIVTKNHERRVATPTKSSLTCTHIIIITNVREKSFINSLSTHFLWPFHDDMITIFIRKVQILSIEKIELQHHTLLEIQEHTTSSHARERPT